jgi:predicted transglutaminase-like cysteine proteinase
MRTSCRSFLARALFLVVPVLTAHCFVLTCAAYGEPLARSQYDGARAIGRSDYSAPIEAALVKWEQFSAGVTEDLKALNRCRAEPDSCSESETRLIDIIDGASRAQGRAKLGVINRAINLAITYKSDAQRHDKPDVWSSALETIGSLYGDCEDFAIVKYVALRASGVEAENLRLMLGRLRYGDMHAVLAVKLDNAWLVLDNRRMAMVDEAEATEIKLFLSFDETGFRQNEGPAMYAGVNVAPASAGRR